jgi:hypothetical protein
MKTFITASALALVSFATLAWEPTPANEKFVGMHSTATVMAELAAAQSRGPVLYFGDADTGVMTSTMSQRSRAEVRAEVLAASARGELVVAGDASLAGQPVQGRAVTRTN